MNLHKNGIIHVLPGDFLVFANSKKMEILRNPRFFPKLSWKINFSCLKEVEVRWLNRCVRSLTPFLPCSFLPQKFPIPSSLASNLNSPGPARSSLANSPLLQCKSPFTLVNLPHNRFISDTPSVQHKTDAAVAQSLYTGVCVPMCIDAHVYVTPPSAFTYIPICSYTKNNKLLS